MSLHDPDEDFIPSGAPIGTTLAGFAAALGLPSDLLAARVPRTWQERIERCLEMYDGDRHGPWDDYLYQMLHRLDAELGEDWRR